MPPAKGTTKKPVKMVRRAKEEEEEGLKSPKPKRKNKPAKKAAKK